MSEKKELNKEQLEKIIGGEEDPMKGYMWCGTCHTATKPKEIYTTRENGRSMVRVCSICNNQY